MLRIVLSLFISIAYSASSYAMQSFEEVILQHCAIVTAATIMEKPLHEIRQLQVIDSDEIKYIRKVTGPHTKKYSADLLNGDELSISYFHAGPRKNQYSCLRTIMNGNGMFARLPVDKKYYFILKDLYKKQKPK